MSALISWNFISINRIPNNYLLFKWMKISTNKSYFKCYSFPFCRFHRFPFYSPPLLISQPNKIFCCSFCLRWKWMLFKWKPSSFHIYSIFYSLPFSIGSRFQQIHISLLSNIFLSPLVRTNNYFRYNKRCKMF